MRGHPVTLKEAAAFVGALHRHHKAPVGHRFSIGAEHGGRLVGVAVIGRPVARRTPQYSVAEVTRLCTDGTKNTCSFLYAAAARICKEMGYDRIQTFILESESGVSLRAAGWILDGLTDGGSWSVPSRPDRCVTQPTCKKLRYVKEFRCTEN